MFLYWERTKEFSFHLYDKIIIGIKIVIALNFVTATTPNQINLLA